ncbi:13712_t:CDS:2 [Entrophospora sp. SA101]|nr:13712_t:CDS:2 [Entrophospora sp. SA101]
MNKYYHDNNMQCKEIFKCVYESEELLNVSFRSGNGYDSSASSDVSSDEGGKEIFKCVYESEELLNVSFRSGNGYDSSASSDIRTSLEEHVRQLHHGKNTDENKIVLEEYQDSKIRIEITSELDNAFKL